MPKAPPDRSWIEFEQPSAGRWLKRLGKLSLIVIPILVIIYQPFTPYTATGAFVALLCGGFIAAVLKICSWTTRRQERARLLADAELQHVALMMGQERLGVHGRFLPARWS